MEPLRRVDIRRSRIYIVHWEEGTPNGFQAYREYRALLLQRRSHLIFDFNHTEIVTSELKTTVIMNRLGSLRVATKLILHNAIKLAWKWKV